MKLRILSQKEITNIPWLHDYTNQNINQYNSKNIYSFLIENDNVLGSVPLSQDGDILHIGNLKMDDSIRKDNTTYSWLKYIQTWAKKHRNCKAITIHVREDNHNFISYCKSLGFTVLRTFKSMPIFDTQEMFIYKLIYYL